MKRLLKGKLILPITLLIGVIISSGIGYGVGSIQSSSVSYTKDGKVMSVEEAIDDLIVKVNEKRNGILSNITLTEKKILSSTPITTNTLKGYLDTVLTGMINVGNYDTKELTAMKNATYTWVSKDSAVVEINGTVVTAKKAGTTEIVGTNDLGGQVIIPIKAVKISYLADVANIGDYVAYDAGTWIETKSKPTSQGQFGGYTKDQNKANSVSWCFNSEVTTSLKGWRVYSIDKSTKTVTLIHGGQPECYYHSGSNNANASVTNLNNRATSTYLNSDYADSAHNMNYDEALSITGSEYGTSNNLRATGGFYWLATTSDTSNLWFLRYEGVIVGNTGYDYDGSMGVRPVVVLKSNILTTGKGTDMVGQTAWTLVKP